jgi:hypothetical protein
MHPVGLEAARKILGPHEANLLACVEDSWKKFSDHFRSQVAIWHPTSRATMVWQLMVDQARVRFADTKGVRLHDSSERFVLVFEDLLVIRMKKLDEQLQTANYPTETAERVDAQLPIGGIPPKATWLTVGYVLDVSQTKIDSVNVVCHVADVVAWEYALQEPARRAEQLPLIPAESNQPRVRAKNQDAKAGRKVALKLVRGNGTER